MKSLSMYNEYMPANWVWKRVVFVGVVFIVLGWLMTKLSYPVNATLESCTASISPNSMTTSIFQTFTVTITNTGSNPILYFN